MTHANFLLTLYVALYVTVCANGCSGSAVKIINHTDMPVDQASVEWIIDRMWDGYFGHDLEIHIDPDPGHPPYGRVTKPSGPMRLVLHREVMTSCLAHTSLVHELLHMWAWDYNIETDHSYHTGMIWILEGPLNMELMTRDPNCKETP